MGVVSTRKEGITVRFSTINDVIFFTDDVLGDGHGLTEDAIRAIFNASGIMYDDYFSEYGQEDKEPINQLVAELNKAAHLFTEGA